MAFLTFVVPADDPGTRIGLNLTLVLTCVAYKYVIAGYLPKTSYLTLLDVYVLVAFALLFLIVVENSVVGYLESQYSKIIDVVTESVMIPCWVILNGVIFIGAVSGLFHQSWHAVEQAQDPI
eukprot:TRINITY_DN180_c0_g1_i7.p1 TRINITY_DN180_c0_g1~~TRINITY_DN180_c0_g1_i7.p1  ORF type:complete len:122 (-),score=25.93 TRINITY_DN180_c0_g1_i7:63-428(-)